MWMAWAANDRFNCDVEGHRDFKDPGPVPGDLCGGNEALDLRSLRLTLSTVPHLLPADWRDQDVGFTWQGEASYNQLDSTYSVIGNGRITANPNLSDTFHFAYRHIYTPVPGSQAEVSVRLCILRPAAGAVSSAGLMVREPTRLPEFPEGTQTNYPHDTFSNRSNYAFVAVGSDGKISFLGRGGKSSMWPARCSENCWLKISITSSDFGGHWLVLDGFYAPENSGGPGIWQQVGTIAIDQSKIWPGQLNVGLVATSNTEPGDGKTAQAQFDHYSGPEGL